MSEMVEFYSDSLLYLIGTVFQTLFDFLYDFMFVKSYNLILWLGDDIFNRLYFIVSSTLGTGKFISLIIGMLLFAPLFKLVINSIRG